MPTVLNSHNCTLKVRFKQNIITVLKENKDIKIRSVKVADNDLHLEKENFQSCE